MTARGCAILVIGALCAGCAPLTATTPPPPAKGAAPPLAQAQRTHEYPSPPVTQTARAPAPDPVTAIRRFTTAYVNWRAPTVSSDLRMLAAQSIGQARSAMELAAGQTEQDGQLRQGGVANHGTVQSVAPRPGHRDQYVVVTLERTTATNTAAYAGLAPAWHVTLATVAELAPGRWVLSGWQPES